MSLMLWLLGISFSVYLEYRPFTQTLKERLPLIVELTPTFNETNAPSMRQRLMDQQEIKEAVFVSRAEAAEVVRAARGVLEARHADARITPCDVDTSHPEDRVLEA